MWVVEMPNDKWKLSVDISSFIWLHKGNPEDNWWNICFTFPQCNENFEMEAQAAYIK